MKSGGAKPVVLVFLGNYLPGHKSGGIVRTVVNTVDHMCDELDFRVVTGDRDVGDDQPYPGVPMNTWVQVGNAQVYYLPPADRTMANLARLVCSVPHDALYLNSFFDPLTVKVLANIRTGAIPRTRVIVAPRGEFAWASLSQKYPKKLVFMIAARLIGLYRNVLFHASSPFEADDIRKVMKITPSWIRVAFDFAVKQADSDSAEAEAARRSGDALRLVFISRVAREKNLDYALRLLQRVRANVIFDIYGPTADAAYWQECQALMTKLPPNVAAAYRGVVDAGRVLDVFSAYELFLFPTGGEAFGQVIAESMLAGTPVLASRESAFRDLEADGLGWDLDLADPAAFAAAIDGFAAIPRDERERRRAAVKTNVATRLNDPAVVEANRQLFLGPLPA